MTVAFVIVLANTVAFAAAPRAAVSPVATATPAPTRLAAVAIAPSPCPSASPGAVPASASPPAPDATPQPCPNLEEIGHVATVGRQVNLVGKAFGASVGTIGPEEIATRPMLRPAELLEQIPGLVISQHSGEGKANQYYLRGFQLDHGTDLEGTVDGIPVNMPTHAHGQGYSDINWLIPEVVSYVQFRKGPYFAAQGDFATAGSYDLFFRDTIAPTAEFGIGDYGYERLLLAASPQVGAGNLLYALEIYHDNGTFVRPDEYHKTNGMLRYSLTKGNTDYHFTAMGYNGPFDSSDQIPQRLVGAGELSPYGYVDPSDGGNTYRYTLSAQLEHRDPNGITTVEAYGEQYFLDLFSNFTYDFFDADNYFNTTANPVDCNPAFSTCTPNAGSNPRAPNYWSYCPAYGAPAGAPPGSIVPAAYDFNCGDQREQRDKRFVTGANATRSFETPRSSTTLGLGTRNDNISTLGLFLTNARNEFPDGTLSDDHVVERASNAWVQSELRIGSKLRLESGLRADLITYSDAAFDPRNSGRGASALVSPKLNLAYELSRHQEFYLDFGEGYHSNDVRSVLYVDDPQTHENFDPTGAPVYQNVLLDRAVGEEVGYRYSVPKLTTMVSLWELYKANELIFDGDHATPSIGGPTQRKGIELANYFTLTHSLTLDADLATSSARFLDDPLHQGTGVPESLSAVISSGITLDEPGLAASLRMRYFGPRQLDTAGDAVSPPSMLFNTQLTKKFARGGRVTLDVYNIVNALVPDVTYFYNSWLPHDARNPANAANPAINPALGGGGVADYHFHPTERRIVRLTFALPM
ncbi:MAG: TonB-dependent receptor plug domain-containing protein [Vulcanimicrobiaceae bacterium]